MGTEWVPPEVQKKIDTGWVPPEAKKSNAKTTAKDIGKGILEASAPTIRGAGPYAAGAAAGAVLGGVPSAGIGAGPGAVAGAGAVGLVDLGLSMYNPIAKMTGLPQAPTINEVVQKGLSKLGVPEVDSTSGRIIQAAAGGVAGAAGAAGGFGQLAKNASGVSKEVLQDLAKAPGKQAIAGGTSGIAGQTAAELGAGPTGQFAASLIGGALPGVAESTAQGVAGQSTSAQTTKRLQEAREVGTKPEPSTVAPSLLNRQLAKVLGSTEEMQKLRADNVKALEKEADRIATSIGEVTTPNQAGKKLEEALGKDGFSKRAKAVEDTLWSKWWTHSTNPGNPADMRVSNTLDYLKNSQRVRGGSENVSELLKDKQLGTILSKFSEDLSPQKSTLLDSKGQPISGPARTGIPYEAIKELRTLIGEKLDPSNMTPDVSKTALKGLYGALSADIKSYAKQLGPEAEKDFNRANTFSRVKNDRIETYLQDTQGKKSYQVWKYATSPDSVKDGGEQFMALNKSLDPAARDTFHATFIKQMGKNAQGEFDPVVFRDKYKSLSPNVKSALLPEAQRPAMDRLMRVITSMEKGGAISGMPGSEGSMGAYMIAGAILHAHPTSLLTVAFASGKSEQIAQLLTSKAMIDHIAGVNHVPVSQAANALNAFINTAKISKEEE